jgi:hypothetical protein
MKDLLVQEELQDILTHSTMEVMNYLLQEDKQFSILCQLDGVTFNPPLPEEIAASLTEMTIFTLSGYTFESAYLSEDEVITFEAGFGKENFGSIVSVEARRIIQILIGSEPIFLNITATAAKVERKNSFDVFAKNPKNKKFFK